MQIASVAAVVLVGCVTRAQRSPVLSLPWRAVRANNFDGINKVCRDLGDCPKGYHWSELAQTCIDDGD
jgi:hypothetical protein